MLRLTDKIILISLILLLSCMVGCSNTPSSLNGIPTAASIEPDPTVLPPGFEKSEVGPTPGVLPDEPESTPIENTPTIQVAQTETPSIEASPTTEPAKRIDKNDHADVISVEVKGNPGSYSFSVGIQSPDTGCDQYADWWEVVDLDGVLIYRRILAHSHVGEQPFTRSGGPVAIEPDTQVILRAHMYNSGYGGEVFEGSVNSSFKAGEPGADFAIELENAPPLPDGCAF